MVYRKRIYYTDTQKAEMWDRCLNSFSLQLCQLLLNTRSSYSDSKNSLCLASSLASPRMTYLRWLYVTLFGINWDTETVDR
jgi:hypothetical protein